MSISLAAVHTIYEVTSTSKSSNDVHTLKSLCSSYLVILPFSYHPLLRWSVYLMQLSSMSTMRTLSWSASINLAAANYLWNLAAGLFYIYFIGFTWRYDAFNIVRRYKPRVGRLILRRQHLNNSDWKSLSYSGALAESITYLIFSRERSCSLRKRSLATFFWKTASWVSRSSHLIRLRTE